MLGYGFGNVTTICNRDQTTDTDIGKVQKAVGFDQVLLFGSLESEETQRGFIC